MYRARVFEIDFKESNNDTRLDSLGFNFCCRCCLLWQEKVFSFGRLNV